jgi:4-amino-4-deoxy-L-arabinose transferase-like glycosyltransferase
MVTGAVQRPLEGRGFAWVLWVMLAITWFATMPVRPLLDPDEGRYAEIPREMAASGDWVTPRLNGLKYFEKPPLQYWATAVAYSAFGESEWTARLWTVGLAFLCLPLTYGWTARVYGRSAGFTALAVLAVSPYFQIIGHLNLLDAGFTFWLAGTVFAFTLAQTAAVGSQSERRWMLAAWIAAALAVLTKGIVVGVLVGLTVVLYTMTERDRLTWRRLHGALGLPLFLLITVPWFVAVTARNPSFPGFFFVHEHFARFLTTVHQRVEPWWYFAGILAIGAIPWLAALPAAGSRAWRESPAAGPFKPLKFLIIFAAVTLLFFSLSGSKLAPYILPLMPPLAAIIGVYGAQRPRFIQSITLASALLLVFIGVGFVIYSGRRGNPLSPAAVHWSIVAAAAAIAGAMATWRASAATRGSAWIAAVSAMLGWQGLLCTFAATPPQHSAYALLQVVRPAIGPDTELFSIGQYRETISPYLQRTLSLVDFTGELEFGLSQEPSKALSETDFLTHWNASRNAVVFLGPHQLSAWRERGLQGRVIASDESTVAVSRL